MFSEDSSFIAANCSGAMISSKANSRKRLVFLQAREEAQNAIAKTEKNEIVVERKRSDFNETLVEEVARNENKTAKIGTE